MGGGDKRRNSKDQGGQPEIRVSNRKNKGKRSEDFVKDFVDIPLYQALERSSQLLPHPCQRPVHQDVIVIQIPNLKTKVKLL